jgi:methionyl-tRNA formyltransferase
VTYAAKLEKTEAAIDWSDSADDIARQVRAFNPWPVASTLWEGQPLRIWQAQAADSALSLGGAQVGAVPGEVLAVSSERLWAQCGHGVLAIERVQLAGRRAISAREFAAARALVGARLG